MKKDKENEESFLSDLPLWGLVFLVCVLLQVYVGKDRPLIQPPRQGSIVKTDQKQVYLPELIQSLFDKEKTKCFVKQKGYYDKNIYHPSAKLHQLYQP